MSGTDYTLTPYLGLYKPIYDMDDGNWGTHLNANADTLDAKLGALTAAAGVSSFNARIGAVHLTLSDVTSIGGAPLASPSFTGIPIAPTATAGTNTTQLATTQFVTGAVAASTAGVSSWNTRTGAVTLLLADVTGVGGAPLASPAFTGAPQLPTGTIAVTQAPGNSTTAVATTAFVTGAVTASVTGVASWNTRTGAVTLSNADVTAVLPASSTTPVMDGTATVGTGTTWARADHIHPTDTSRYAASNPSGYQTAAQVALAVSPNVGRNLVHNSMFNIAQRGVGPFTSGYTLDRWAIGFTGGTMSVSQVALTDADRAAIGDEAAEFTLQTVFTGGGGAAASTVLQYPWEDVRRTSGKTLTISFWAKAASGTPKIGINFVQAFGTGGSPSAVVQTTPGAAVTTSTTWARYSVTITLPSTAGKVLGTNNDNYTAASFWFSSGSTNNTLAGGIGVQSGTFQIWGVQCEIGTVMTPLEKLDPAMQLQQCQRFYRRIGGVNLGMRFDGNAPGGGVQFSSTIVFPDMRGQPTVTVVGAWSVTNCSNPTILGGSVSTAVIGTVPVAAGGWYFLTTGASTYVDISADL